MFLHDAIAPTPAPSSLCHRATWWLSQNAVFKSGLVTKSRFHELAYLTVGCLHLRAVLGALFPLCLFGIEPIHHLHQGDVLGVGHAFFEVHGHKSVGNGFGEQRSVRGVFLVAQGGEATRLFHDVRSFDENSDQVFNMVRN